MGRSTGYTYAKNGTVQQTVTTGYGSDGRIASAGFLHGGAAKQFSYEYLSGTHLLEKLTKPNGMTLTQSYEIQRDLLTGMAYHRGSTLVAQREYVYDTLGRPTARNTSRQGTVKNDTFGYNNRSELTTATVNGSNYAYDYDNIGNRTTATEGDESTTYTANAHNQYTSIQENEEAAFTPTFDADGNQTLVKTTTGIWAVVYDAENRPVSFTNTESSIVVDCAYDSMGRRATKKVTVDGNITLHQRYLYRGYLQIACCDLTRSNHPALWLITWDPTQPIATRPLAIQKDGTWYSAPARLASQDSRSQECSRLGVWLLKSHPAYGWDLTKNICELYGSNGYIRTAYTYSPYGSVTESGNTWQPTQWSSEYNDTELGLVYYNYRHYNPMDGRWLGKDLISQKKIYNSYSFVCNNVSTIDRLGLKHMKASTSCDGSVEIKQYSPFFQDNYPNETIYYKGEKQGVLAGVFITVMYQQGNLSDSCCCSSWRWMQTIWTNAPLGGDSSPYVDPRPNTDDKPWYYTDEDYEKHKLINGTVFFDSPTREGKEGTNIYWRAELILKCLNKKGKVKRDIVYIYY